MYRVRIPIGLGLLAALGLIFYLDYYSQSTYATSIVVSLMALGALWEFFGLVERRRYQPYKYFAMIATVIVFVIEIIGGTWYKYQPMAIVGLCLLLFLRLFRDATKDTALEDCAFTLLGLVYISFLLGYYTLLVRSLGNAIVDGVYYLALIVLASKSMDIGGYLIGVKFGKHKIYPSISPKKSYEGTGGGLAMAVVVTFAMRWLFPTVAAALPEWYQALVFALLMGSFSLIGDLCESLVKRRCDAKDSGNLLPEFGGMLDMVDSVLFTMPLGYYFLRWTLA